MLKIVIPDPGLREYGGHHPAMINSIANTNGVINGDIQLDVFCNKDCSDDFINKTQAKQVKIKKHFTTNFYQYFYQSPSIASLNVYINQLTKEYLSVFEQHTINEKQDNASTEKSRVLFLYHTLNAEHAIALASAIAIFNKHYSIPLHHFVFLMFNPIKHSEEGEFNNRHFLNFKVGFSLLVKQNFVQYYVGENELQRHYQYLLNSNNRIAIHPCGLVSQNNKKAKKNKIVILFMGDAKVNKGFLTLPDLAGEIMQSIADENVEFIIQYTITNSGEALKKVDKILQSLAKSDSRIKLTTRFWSHTELHENFAKANCIIFNYDSLVYKNQSSGVLWLAASYNLNMVFLTSNWLMREAEKLDCRYSYCSYDSFSQEVQKYLMQNSSSFDSIAVNKYREALFYDIGSWLLKESSPHV
jgi:hypothetical protein